METSKNNVFGWVEVPVADMVRAMKFYETVFDFKIERHQMGPLDMGWFPWVENGLGSGGFLGDCRLFSGLRADRAGCISGAYSEFSRRL